MGPSPIHSRTVHLILSPLMGHVSQEFHVKHDDFFETIKSNEMSFNSQWADWNYFSGLYRKRKSNQDKTEQHTSSAMPEAERKQHKSADNISQRKSRCFTIKSG